MFAADWLHVVSRDVQRGALEFKLAVAILVYVRSYHALAYAHIILASCMAVGQTLAVYLFVYRIPTILHIQINDIELNERHGLLCVGVVLVHKLTKSNRIKMVKKGEYILFCIYLIFFFFQNV